MRHRDVVCVVFSLLLIQLVVVACSDETKRPDEPGFDSSISDEASTDELSDTDFGALCEEALGYVDARVSAADQLRVVCTARALLDEVTSEGCQSAVASCLETGGALDLCSSRPSVDACQVTVAEVEACVSDQADWLLQLADALACELAGDQAALQALGAQAPAACDALLTRCPGWFVEPVDIDTGGEPGDDGGPDAGDDGDVGDDGGAGDLSDDTSVFDFGDEQQTECEIIFVDQDAVGADNGSSWQNAFIDLQDALAEAAIGICTEIWVAEGTYRPAEAAGTRAATFQLLDGVSLYGGFAGDETARGQRQPAANVTLLSGDLAGDDDGLTNNAENSFHVVSGSATDASALIDGFVITGGNANGEAPDNVGGGMAITNGSPTVTDVSFIENAAAFGGGIGLRSASSPRITDCVFEGNVTTIAGGGIDSAGADPTIVRCTFRSNTTVSGGGGIAFESAGAGLVVDSLFIANTATNYGGGMRIGGTTTSTSPVIVNSRFIANTAGLHGGGLYIRNPETRPQLINCLIVGNIAPIGAGVINTQGASPTFSQCTVANNHASSTGGGFANSYSFTSSVADLPAGDPVIVNSVLWGNTDSGGVGEATQFYLQSGEPTVTYSSIEGANPFDEEDGNIQADPGFVDVDGLDDTPNTEDDDYGLGSGSACIDAGDNDALPADLGDLDRDGDIEESLPSDLRGGPRQIDDPGVADTGSGVAPIVDLGAYERAQ